MEMRRTMRGLVPAVVAACLLTTAGTALAQDGEGIATVVLRNSYGGGPPVVAQLLGVIEEELPTYEETMPVEVTSGAYQVVFTAADTGAELVRETGVTIEAGFAYEFTLSNPDPDEPPRLFTNREVLPGNEEAGTLVFLHDERDAPGLFLAAAAADGSGDEPNLGSLEPGQSVEAALLPGDYELEVYRENSEDDLLASTAFRIASGRTTTVRASALLADTDGDGQVDDAAAEDDDPDGGDEVRVPTRVDTGAGGTAGGPAGRIAAAALAVGATVAAAVGRAAF